MKIIIPIEGMSCGHCSGAVEKALKALPNVDVIEVDHKGGSATVEVDGVSKAALADAVEELGYVVDPAFRA